MYDFHDRTRDYRKKHASHTGWCGCEYCQENLYALKADKVKQAEEAIEEYKAA